MLVFGIWSEDTKRLIIYGYYAVSQSVLGWAKSSEMNDTGHSTYHVGVILCASSTHPPPFIHPIHEIISTQLTNFLDQRIFTTPISNHHRTSNLNSSLCSKQENKYRSNSKDPTTLTLTQFSLPRLKPLIRIDAILYVRKSAKKKKG